MDGLTHGLINEICLATSDHENNLLDQGKESMGFKSTLNPRSTSLIYFTIYLFV